LGGGYRGVHGRLLSIGVAGRSVSAGNGDASGETPQDQHRAVRKR